MKYPWLQWGKACGIYGPSVITGLSIHKIWPATEAIPMSGKTCHVTHFNRSMQQVKYKLKITIKYQ